MNFELEKEILGFGETVKVLSPVKLVRRIMKRGALVNQMYTKGIHPVVAEEVMRKVSKKGHAILDGVYNDEEVEKIKKTIFVRNFLGMQKCAQDHPGYP